MNKIYFIVLPLIMVPGIAFAQSGHAPGTSNPWTIGVRGGLSSVELTGSDVGNGQSDRLLSWESGAVAELRRWPWVNFQFELAYKTRGRLVQVFDPRIPNAGPILSEEFVFHYIDTHPLNLRFTPPVAWPVVPYAAIGGRLSYLLSARGENNNGIRRDLRQSGFKFGVVASVGVEADVGDGRSLALEARLDQDLQGFADNTSRKFSSLSLGLAYRWTIPPVRRGPPPATGRLLPAPDPDSAAETARQLAAISELANRLRARRAPATHP